MTTVLITGANRGIGLELARQYQQRDASVIAVCRNAGDDLPSLDVRIIDGIDVADADSIARLADDLGDTVIDILVNNAGILRGDDIAGADPEDMLDQYRINAIGPLLVTRALAGNLRKGSRVGIVTSRVGSIADNGSGGNYGYRASKAAANMIGMNLHHDLKGRGIAVAMLHPGFVATGMTGGNGIPASDAAAGLIERLEELDLDSSGGFWHANGERLPW